MINTVSLLRSKSEKFTSPQGYLLTILACGAMTLIATPLHTYFDLANIVMLFLLTVQLVAAKLGRNQAILASVLSVYSLTSFSYRHVFLWQSATSSIWSRLPSCW